MEFKLGDTVQLKSGGPLMTVSNVTEEAYMQYSKGDVSCTWFEGNTVKQATFKSAMLNSSTDASKTTLKS